MNLNITNSILWNNNRDRKAFFQALTRVTYPISYDIFDIQEIKNREKNDCDNCSDNKADFRIVKNQHNPFTVYWCMHCIEEEMQDWMDNHLENLKQHLDRYQVAEEL